MSLLLCDFRSIYGAHLQLCRKSQRKGKNIKLLRCLTLLIRALTSAKDGTCFTESLVVFTQVLTSHQLIGIK